MGPQSARSYPGRRVVKPAPPKAQRAKQEIDYGRRGKGYVFGAFRPASRRFNSRASMSNGLTMKASKSSRNAAPRCYSMGWYWSQGRLIA